MSTTIDIHRATQLRAEVRHYNEGSEQAFTVTRIYVRTEGGSETCISAFSAEALQIEGAEHINAVASNEVPA